LGGYPPKKKAHKKARAKRARGVWGDTPQGKKAHTKVRAKRAPGGSGGYPPRKEGTYEGPSEASPGALGGFHPRKKAHTKGFALSISCCRSSLSYCKKQKNKKKLHRVRVTPVEKSRVKQRDDRGFGPVDVNLQNWLSGFNDDYTI
jgi:hypothetical protein